MPTERTNVILVTGGTGHLGRDLVKQLRRQNRNVRVLARNPRPDPTVQWVRGDLSTGEGLADAVQGVHTVISAATLSPIARRGGRMSLIDFFRTPSSVDVQGTARLLEAANKASIAHFLHVSIVGLDDAKLPYGKVKLAGERLVRESNVPWSVVRATPFYYLVKGMLEGMHWMPIWAIPDASVQPVDTSDAAAYLAECVDDGKRGMREEIGGPEIMNFVDLARVYQRARVIRRPIWPLPLSDKTARGMGFCAATGGRRGAVTWSAWLNQG